MLTIREKIAAFWRDESGTETVEWAILAALLIAVTVAVWSGLGAAVKAKIIELTSMVTGTAA
jgi:Flp pilus assembly pilin Flp